MSYDRFKEFANRTGKDEEERKLIEEALKATKEGRESDRWRYIDRLIDKNSKKERKPFSEYTNREKLDAVSPLVLVVTALIVDFLNVSIESTKTNLQIFLGAMLFIGPGLIAAIVTKSYKVFFSYIWNVLLLTLGLQIFAAIIGLDQSTQGFLYIIGLGIIAVWKIIDNKPDIETQKFPYTFSTVMVTSMLSVIILVVISDTADKSPESLIQEQIAIVKVRSANIRSGTSTNHKIVGNAKLGDTLKVVSTSNDWLLIEHKNLQGYIHQKLVNNLNTTSKE